MPIWKRKTFWGAVAGMATSIGAYMAGEITLGPFIQAMIAAMVIIFLRQGMDKGPCGCGR